MNKILLIGCGHMGSALLKAWYKKTSYNFTVIDPKKYISLNRQFKNRVKAYSSIKQIDKKFFDIIIFAVKPQIIDGVMKQFIKENYNKKVLFISIIAGKKISFFKRYLPKGFQFIRVMPNMPALIEEGMSCLVANNDTSILNKNKSMQLFKIVGKVLFLKNEKELDKVTAISGSGPGYYFLFIHYLEKAAKKIGFSKKISSLLVQQTALGSIKLLLNEKKSSIELANNIAIKGGTTEAALRQFKKKNKLNNIINDAVTSAYKRAIKLGK
tara:strand:+ start:1110 stop:1916 length:807 start_codon:yes stop_codon:yes gene_type:complete